MIQYDILLIYCVVQSLGEMVIGAFKHAGRRRMAFSIGTRMAEFHKLVTHYCLISHSLSHMSLSLSLSLPPSLSLSLSLSLPPPLPLTRHVGMVKEAEQVLCDVTSLHSVQHWPQLSASAYSILGYCQQRLKQEDKYVIYYIIILLILQLYRVYCILRNFQINSLVCEFSEVGRSK